TGTEPWMTDGVRVARLGDLAPGPADSNPHDIVALGDGIVFAAGGGQPWACTLDGCAQLADLGSSPSSFMRLGDAVLFSACGPERGCGLRRTAGLAVSAVDEINPATKPSSPADFVRLGDAVVLRATDQVHGVQLWRADGVEPPRALAFGSGEPEVTAVAGDRL